LPPWTYLLLVPAGVVAGITGSVAGLASLVSYPALLALGLPPVIANVSNAVALVFGGIGAVSASRVELAGQARRIAPLALATISGGVIGSLLLMIAPAVSFVYVVPWLIAGASAAVLLPRRIGPRAANHAHKPALYAGTTIIGVYGGYFGAASGVLFLALLLATTDDTLPQTSPGVEPTETGYDVHEHWTFAHRKTTAAPAARCCATTPSPTIGSLPTRRTISMRGQRLAR
jgi:uncharacterized membrane protein YfcA